MQISVMPYSFARDMRSGSMSLPGFFAACAELGADGVEISNSDVARLGEEAVRELLAQHQLDFPTYIISKDFVTEDEARFRRAVQEMRDEIDRGKRLGASKVMLSTGSPKADIADDRARGAHWRGPACGGTVWAAGGRDRYHRESWGVGTVSGPFVTDGTFSGAGTSAIVYCG